MLEKLILGLRQNKRGSIFQRGSLRSSRNIGNLTQCLDSSKTWSANYPNKPAKSNQFSMTYTSTWAQDRSALCFVDRSRFKKGISFAKHFLTITIIEIWRSTIASTIPEQIPFRKTPKKQTSWNQWLRIILCHCKNLSNFFDYSSAKAHLIKIMFQVFNFRWHKNEFNNKSLIIRRKIGWISSIAYPTADGTIGDKMPRSLWRFFWLFSKKNWKKVHTLRSRTTSRNRSLDEGVVLLSQHRESRPAPIPIIITDQWAYILSSKRWKRKKFPQKFIKKSRIKC